jgi:hypothetical protein
VATEALDKLFDQIRSLMDSEYHRGEQETIARIMQAAQGDVALPAPLNGASHGNKPKRKNPAPRGTAKKLIDRVLKERGMRGASPTEIKAAAVGRETELSHSGLRFALTLGKDKNRYRNKDGKWFLAASSEAPLA